MTAALDDIADRLDRVAEDLDRLEADLAQLAGDRPAAPSREEIPA